MENPLLNNFRFVQETEVAPTQAKLYDTIEGYKVYKSTFKESLLIIYDEDRNIYHEFDYEGMNPFNEKEIEAYIKKYNEDNS